MDSIWCRYQCQKKIRLWDNYDNKIIMIGKSEWRMFSLWGEIHILFFIIWYWHGWNNDKEKSTKNQVMIVERMKKNCFAWELKDRLYGQIWTHPRWHCPFMIIMMMMMMMIMLIMIRESSLIKYEPTLGDICLVIFCQI